jgi:peptidyl-prolyl cis-trans isomerase D
MISKFSKMHNSIFTKVVLTITALSFMSLFGVSGYINSANNNKAVIKVDNIEVTQSEFSYMLQRQLAQIRNVLGDEDSDENEDKKREIAAGLADMLLENALIDNTMQKYKIDFTESLVRNIILATPQFQINGQFNRDIYNQYLRSSGLTEKELLTEIKRGLARKILLDTQTAYVNVPQVLQRQMEKISGQRRTFKYIKLVAAETKINREPTADELNQYYEDLSEEFTVPEKRDITMLALSMDNIENNITIPQEDIDEYYQEHIDEFEQPESREVQQITFTTKEDADAAVTKIADNEDFAEIAKQQGQTDEETNFGFVTLADLPDELAGPVFQLNVGEITAPLNVNNEWQILKVTAVTPAVTTAKEDANAQIAAELKLERAYDGIYDVINNIDDKIAAGASLAEIAQIYNVPLIKVTQLDEDGNSSSRNADVVTILQNPDVREAAFSYNEGEISQTVEGDNGVYVIQVDKITESHLAPQEDVADKIKQLWLENERAALVQETVDNIEHDLEAGDSFTEVAQRYSLPIVKTMPITRSETFAGLTFEDIKTLFAQPKDTPQTLKSGNDYFIAVTGDIYDDSASLSAEDKEFLKQALYAENMRELSSALLKGYAKDYKVEVNYNRMGLNE